MSLTVPRLLGPSMPNELKVACFSWLPLHELVKAGLVCDDWFQLSKDNLLWNPILQQLDPFANRLFTNDNDTKTSALNVLRNHQRIVNLIISHVENDSQLASVIGIPSVSLEDLKKMLPIERTLYVMRALRKDCTGLFVHLSQMYHRDAFDYDEEMHYLAQSNNQIAAPEEYMRDVFHVMVRFQAQNQTIDLLHELVRNPPGYFNPSEAMSAIAPLARFSFKRLLVLEICGFLVKSHHSLSDFFKSNIVYLLSRDPQLWTSIPAVEFTRGILIPSMSEHRSELNVDVTEDEWKECGYEAPNHFM